MTRLSCAAACVWLSLSPSAGSAQPAPLVLRDHDEAIFAVAFSPDGKTVAAGGGIHGSKHKVCLWDAATSKVKAHLSPGTAMVAALAFAPDGKWLAVGGNDRPQAGLAPTGKTVLWDLAARKPAVVLPVTPSPTEGLAFSADGRILVTGGQNHLTAWDTREGKLLRQFEQQGAPGAAQPWVGVKDAIRSVAFAPGDKLLATAGILGGLRLWDVDSGRELARLTPAKTYVQSVAFSPDGRTLASAGGTDAGAELKLWDVAHRKERATLQGLTGEVRVVTFSRDGRWLASAGADGTVDLWDAGTGTKAHVLSGHDNMTFCLAFSPDGQRLVSGGIDRTVRVWPVPRGK